MTLTTAGAKARARDGLVHGSRDGSTILCGMHPGEGEHTETVRPAIIDCPGCCAVLSADIGIQPARESGPPASPPPTFPRCQGDARFTSAEQAQYVADALPDDIGGEWEIVPCADHWHVHEVATLSTSATERGF